ncbi:hypothetical protein [Pseudonocardia sp.]|uniref:hypothetical protein n=1 Tax=Pseudonocardia sp. TaxID=60912 RepID=UPI0026163456|nr:hypothetical protein [Pseudonocardia sp.]MCW2716185.1 putative rane protein [Pseudonocardia sp.]
MSDWLGDLFYPDNPRRRDEVNQLHQQAVGLSALLSDRIAVYNGLVPDVQKLASQNALLRAIKLAMRIGREDLQHYQDVELSAYQQPLWLSIAKTLADLGLAVTTGNLIKAAWNLSTAVRAGQGAEVVAASEVAEFSAGMGQAADVASVMGVEGAAEVASMEASIGAEVGTDLGAEAIGLESAEAGVAAVGEFSAVETAGIGLVIAAGVSSVLSAIGGGQERDELEGQISRLGDLVGRLTHDRDLLTQKLLELTSARRQLIARYNMIRAEFMRLDPMPGETGRLFDDQGAITPIVMSQSRLITRQSQMLALGQHIRQLIAQHVDFASDQGRYLQELVDIGAADTVDQAAACCRLIADMDVPEVTPGRVHESWEAPIVVAEAARGDFSVTMGADGRLDVMFTDTGGRLMRTSQTADRRSWTGVSPIAATEVADWTQARTADGDLAVVYRAPYDAVYCDWRQVDGNWHGPTAIGWKAAHLAVVTTDSVALLMYYIAADNTLRTGVVPIDGVAQRPLPSDIPTIGVPASSPVTVVKDVFRSLNVFYIGSDANLYCLAQDLSTDRHWQGPVSLGGPRKAFTVGVHDDGRLEVFTIAADDALHRNFQRPEDPTMWSGPTALGLSARSVTTASNTYGFMELFGVRTDGTLFHAWRTHDPTGFEFDEAVGVPGQGIAPSPSEPGWPMGIFSISVDGLVSHLAPADATGERVTTNLGVHAERVVPARDLDGRILAFFADGGGRLCAARRVVTAAPPRPRVPHW